MTYYSKTFLYTKLQAPIGTIWSIQPFIIISIDRETDYMLKA